MTNKTLEFTLAVKVDESVVTQVKDTIVGSKREHPPLAETVVTLVREKLSEMGMADDCTVKLDYRRTVGPRPALRGGLNPQEWLDKPDHSDPTRPKRPIRRLGSRD